MREAAIARCAATRPAVAVALGTMLIGAVGCGGLPTAGITAWPVATNPTESPITARDDDVTPQDLEHFLGNGLRFADHGAFGLDRATLLTTADAPGGTMLRVSYPQGSASRAAGGPEGGMQAYMQLPGGPVDALDLKYQVRFPPGFDFVKGGKLPGLYGGTVTGGRRIPDGTNGFSTRYMWRDGGAGEVYAYLPSSREHGTSLGRGYWSFTPGRWTTIHQRVQLNTPGASDGRVAVWLDGKPVLHETGLQFRTSGDLRIDGLFFSTFFGGSDSSWASPAEQYTDFAGFSIFAGSDAPPPPPPGGLASGGPADSGIAGSS